MDMNIGNWITVAGVLVALAGPYLYRFIDREAKKKNVLNLINIFIQPLERDMREVSDDRAYKANRWQKNQEQACTKLKPYQIYFEK